MVNSMPWCVCDLQPECIQDISTGQAYAISASVEPSELQDLAARIVLGLNMLENSRAFGFGGCKCAKEAGAKTA